MQTHPFEFCVNICTSTCRHHVFDLCTFKLYLHIPNLVAKIVEPWMNLKVSKQQKISPEEFPGHSFVSFFFPGNFRRKWFSENFLRISFWVLSELPRGKWFQEHQDHQGEVIDCVYCIHIYILYIYLYMHACMMMLGFMELPGAEASLAAAGCFAGSLECLGAPGPRQPSLVRGKVDGARGHGVHPTSCESSSSAGGRWKMWKWGHVNPKQTQKH